MAKIGIFKKIAALATAIAIVLCFAVTASAFNVTTTTSYVDGAEGDILVEVLITAEEDDIVDKSVSYYAYDSEGSAVYIDQIEDGSSEIFFDYVTDSADLNSDVKIGYTGASEAGDAKVDGIKVTWGTEDRYVPTAATTATVVFDTEATSITSISAEGADYVSHVLTAGKSVSIVLENFTGDDVKLTVVSEAQAIAQIIGAAFVISNGSDDIAIKDLEDDKAAIVDTIDGEDLKLTAIGKVTGCTTYGIYVSESEESNGDQYQAAGKTANGFYAVQLIDSIENGTMLNKDATYYVRAYADTTVSSDKKTVEKAVDLSPNN